MRRSFALAGLFLLTLFLPVRFAPEVRAESAKPDGAALYQQHCASCHGPQGRGDGPDAAHFQRRPRDLAEVLPRAFDEEALVRRVLEGRPLPLAVDPVALREREHEVAGIESHLRRLAATAGEKRDRGWALYSVRCAACHGPFGRPDAPAPAGVRALRDLGSPEFQSALDPAQLIEAVRHGRRGMPALTPRIQPAEAEALAVFVRLLSPGFESYQRLCSGCHGDDGRPVEDPDSVVTRPRRSLDAAYLAGTDPEALRTRLWHMVGVQQPAMPHFRAVVREREARAIVQYLRQQEKDQ